MANIRHLRTYRCSGLNNTHNSYNCLLRKTAQLTSGCRALLEKLIVTKLVKFPAFYTTQRLIIISTGVHKSTKLTLINFFNHTWSVRKVSDLWPGKRNWLTWSVGHLITLKVVPLGLHTLLPAVLPLLEACRKSLFRNGV